MVSQRLMNIDPRFHALDRKIDMWFDALETLFDHRFDLVDERFQALDKKMDRQFMWTIGVVMATWLTTIASIYGHH